MFNLLKKYAVLSAIGLAVITGAPASAQSANMGQLAEHLPQYTEEAPWRLGMVDSVFRMENMADINANYWFHTPLNRDVGASSVSVDVRIVEGDPEYSHAGLLYGFTDKNSVRFFYTIETGKVTLFEMAPGSANALMVTETDAVKSGWNTLKITEVDGMINLIVNGKEIGGIGNDHTGKGSVGIVAWGTGGFEFKNFKTGS